MKITIFTPTYNREKLLVNLYSSILNQDEKNFEWLIIDDGSIDNTEFLVNKWISDNKVNIKYIYQENSGKWKAFNNAIKNATGELLFCVDSDDILEKDAIKNIIECYEHIKKKEFIAGILAVKVDTCNKRLGDDFPKEVVCCDTYLLSKKYLCNGEWALIYKTDILKRNSFPDVYEKFLPEGIVYDKIATNYKMLLLDKVINICEYQEDGYSNNYLKVMINNPLGFKIYYAQRIDMALKFKERFNYIIRYNAFNNLSKDKLFNYEGKYKWFIKGLMPLGWVLEKYYKSKIKD